MPLLREPPVVQETQVVVKRLPAECEMVSCIISNCTACVAGWGATLLFIVLCASLLLCPAKVRVAPPPGDFTPPCEESPPMEVVTEAHDVESVDAIPESPYAPDMSRCPSILNPCVPDSQMFAFDVELK
jgi:hypothetical protein